MPFVYWKARSMPERPIIPNVSCVLVLDNFIILDITLDAEHGCVGSLVHIFAYILY